MKRLEFTIDETTGAVTVEAHGYKGPNACQDATADFDAVLGTMDKRAMKSDNKGREAKVVESA